MAFKHVTSANGRFGKDAAKSTSQAILDGQVLVYTGGLVVPADNTTTFAEAEYVSTAAVTAGAALASAHVFKISENDQFIADTVNNSNVAHNGQKMILNSTGTAANNTGTTSAVGVVRQIAVYGDAADKLIVCEFVTK